MPISSALKRGEKIHPDEIEGEIKKLQDRMAKFGENDEGNEMIKKLERI